MVFEMKPILVVVHIYYSNLWSELKKSIQSIQAYPFELYVTMTEKKLDIEEDIHQTFPKAKIEIVDNRGYDVGPFVHVLNKLNLDNYSYIVKLQTKRDLPRCNTGFRNMHSSIWRENLLIPYRQETTFKKYIDYFDKCPQVGMQANYQVIVHKDTYDKKAKELLDNFLKEHHLPKMKHAFVAGTMFIARAHLFKPLQELKIDLDDFPEQTTHAEKHTSQLAHALERFLGYMVYYQGLIISDGAVSTRKQQMYHKNIYLKSLLTPVVHFFWQKKVTRSGKLLIKIFKIPVLRIKRRDND